MEQKKPNPLNPTAARFNTAAAPAALSRAASGRTLPAKLLIVVLSFVITVSAWRAMIIDADFKQVAAAAAEQIVIATEEAEDALAQAEEEAIANAVSAAEAQAMIDAIHMREAQATAAALSGNVPAGAQATPQPVPTVRVVPPAAQVIPRPTRRPRVRTRSST